MSIWVTREPVGHDDWPGVPMRGGDVRSYASGFSNHYPTTDGEYEQPCFVSLAHIPTWCVPGHEKADDYDDFPVGEWVRLDVVTHDHENGRPVGGPWSHSVVMDEAAARQLAADLIEWADSPKVHPHAEG